MAWSTAHGTPKRTPSVCAVIPTRNRPDLLRRAVHGVLDQAYPGEVSVIVVLDRAEDGALGELRPSSRVTVMVNDRTPGLAGARNTGILMATSDLVAFCDDDDVWLPNKLEKQVAALSQMPAGKLATCAIDVDFDGRHTVRLANTSLVSHQMLVESRMSMLHSSTFLIRRAALLGDLGLVDEQVPGGQNEDWDLLLRASELHPVVHVDLPLVTVRWSSGSYFNRQWETKVSSLEWMLERHPDIADCPAGSARVYGQIAFGHAASGARRLAIEWARRSARASWREPRAYLATAAAAGLPAEFILRTLHRFGRGV